MRRRALLLVASSAVIACERSLDLPFEDDGARLVPSPRAIETLGPAPTSTPIVWHSWDVTLQTTLPEHAFVMSTNGEVRASLAFYGADAVATHEVATYNLDTYGTAAAPSERFAAYWEASANAEPRIGKSATLRGTDQGEAVMGVPLPIGVYDLEMHPQNSDNQPGTDRPAVVAFIAPRTARYRLDGFAIRIVEPEDTLCDDGVRALVFTSSGSAAVDLSVSLGDLTWKVASPSSIPLGVFTSGSRIHFVVASDEPGVDPTDETCDATEVAFTLVAIP